MRRELAPTFQTRRWRRRRQMPRVSARGAHAFIRCDYATGLSGPYDLIVSNPPYVRSGDIADLAIEVRDHDPLAALDGGTDGLDAYRALIPRRRESWPRAPHWWWRQDRANGQINALMTTAGLTPHGAPKADLAGIRGRSGAAKCPDKVLLERKKTSWNLPGNDYVPATTSVKGCWLAPRRCGWKPEFRTRARRSKVPERRSYERNG